MTDLDRQDHPTSQRSTAAHSWHADPEPSPLEADPWTRLTLHHDTHPTLWALTTTTTASLSATATTGGGASNPLGPRVSSSRATPTPRTSRLSSIDAYVDPSSVPGTGRTDAAAPNSRMGTGRGTADRLGQTGQSAMSQTGSVAGWVPALTVDKRKGNLVDPRASLPGSTDMETRLRKELEMRRNAMVVAKRAERCEGGGGMDRGDVCHTEIYTHTHTHTHRSTIYTHIQRSTYTQRYTHTHRHRDIHTPTQIYTHTEI